MCYNAAIQIASPEVEKGDEETEQRGVSQLEKNSDNAWQDDRWCHGCSQVGLSRPLMDDDMLIEMMKVGQAEDERRADDDISRSRLEQTVSRASTASGRIYLPEQAERVIRTGNGRQAPHSRDLPQGSSSQSSRQTRPLGKYSIGANTANCLRRYPPQTEDRQTERK